MIPTIVAHVRDAYELLHAVAERARDSTPAWEFVAGDIFNFERRWWQLTYGDEEDKDQRPGRNPAYMEETGGLHAAATRRGAPRQVVDIGKTHVFIGVTHGLAGIHEARGRQVLGEPTHREARQIVERVGTYILTGRPDG